LLRTDHRRQSLSSASTVVVDAAAVVVRAKLTVVAVVDVAIAEAGVVNTGVAGIVEWSEF
jgi:hypothetical protein